MAITFWSMVGQSTSIGRNNPPTHPPPTHPPPQLSSVLPLEMGPIWHRGRFRLHAVGGNVVRKTLRWFHPTHLVEFSLSQTARPLSRLLKRGTANAVSLPFVTLQAEHSPGIPLMSVDLRRHFLCNVRACLLWQLHLSIARSSRTTATSHLSLAT